MIAIHKTFGFWDAAGGFPGRRPRPPLARVAPGPTHAPGFAYHAKAMVKADLINRAMEAANVQGPVAREAVEALFERLRAALERGDRVVLRRFGVFRAAPRKTGVARNPRTGEAVGIPPGRVVRFRPGQTLRRLVGSS